MIKEPATFAIVGIILALLLYGPKFFTDRDYIPKGLHFLNYIDESVNPCTDFYKFTCGKYRESTAKSPSFANPDDVRYLKQRSEIENILSSRRDLPGFNLSLSRNIFKRCSKLADVTKEKNKFLESVMHDIGYVKCKYYRYGKKNYKLNELNKNFDWIYAVHKLRKLGLNFRFLFGLYVNPRSEMDRRNILEIRQPFLANEKNDFKTAKNRAVLLLLIESMKMENLTIKKAGDFIKSVKNVFPMKKYIDGLLPDNVKLSRNDEIRLDEEYIKAVLQILPQISGSELGKMLLTKIEREIDFLLLSKVKKTERARQCYAIVFRYDSDFQMAVAKHFLTDIRKNYVANMTQTILETTKSFIKNSANFDEESATKTIDKLSNLDVLIGYSNSTLGSPSDLDWSDRHTHNYLKNIFKLSKYRMDAKFRQINFVTDIREWNTDISPFVYNVGYDKVTNRIQLPALYLASKMYGLDLPSFVTYGTVGFVFGHELSHAIHASTKQFPMLSRTDLNTTFNNFLKNVLNITSDNNFASSRIERSKDCLMRKFFDLTGEYKKNGYEEDFADLIGYKLAYHSFLGSEQLSEADDKPLPGFKYNSRQMFWIASASQWCSKNAFKTETKDKPHSRDYVRVVLPLSNLPEFARDFKCPVGSPMNPRSKCNFL